MILKSKKNLSPSKMTRKQFITLKIDKGKEPQHLSCLSYVTCITGNQVVGKCLLIKLFLLINESEMIKVENHPFYNPSEL